MHYLTLIVFLVGCLLASPAFATSSLTQCHSTTVAPSSATVEKDGCVAWRWDSDNEDSPAIHIRTPTGLICFDPDTGAAGAGTSQVMIWHCPDGLKPSANFGYTCHEILDTPLTGLVGASGTQNACIRVGAGTYFSEVSVAPSSEDSVVYFHGEGE